MRFSSHLLSVIALSLVASCGEEAVSTPRVRILEPANGAVVTLEDLLRFEVENFRIVEFDGRPAAAGEGHFHVLVDGTYTMTVERELSFGELAGAELGGHTIEVELHDSAHARVSPQEAASIQVTLVDDGGGEDAPQITILSPTEGSSVSRSAMVEFTIDRAFELVPPAPGDPIDGQGHVHGSLDGHYVGNFTSTSFPLEDLLGADAGAGAHTLGLQLMQNNHSAIRGSSEVTVSFELVP